MTNNEITAAKLAWRMKDFLEVEFSELYQLMEKTGTTRDGVEAVAKSREYRVKRGRGLMIQSAYKRFYDISDELEAIAELLLQADYDYHDTHEEAEEHFMAMLDELE